MSEVISNTVVKRYLSCCLKDIILITEYRIPETTSRVSYKEAKATQDGQRDMNVSVTEAA